MAEDCKNTGNLKFTIMENPGNLAENILTERPAFCSHPIHYPLKKFKNKINE